MPPSTLRRVLAVVGGVGFALAPWASLGFLTPVAFGLAIGVLRSWSVILSTVVYSATWVTLLTTAGADDGTPREAAFITALLVGWVLGGVHALVLAPQVVRALRGRPPPPAGAATGEVAAEVAAETRASMAKDPVLRRVLQRRTRRELAREIVTSDPALAADLGIGRPELGRGFKDGGLVDVNAVPSTVLSDLPGFDEAMAQRVVAARERHGSLQSGAELVVYADVPQRVVDKLADRLLFTPLEE